MVSPVSFNAIKVVLSSKIPLNNNEVSDLAKVIHKANNETTALSSEDLKDRIEILGKINSNQKVLPKRGFRWHLLTLGISYFFIKMYDQHKASGILKEKQELIDKYLGQMLKTLEPTEANIMMLKNMLDYTNQKNTKEILTFVLRQKEAIQQGGRPPIGTPPEVQLKVLGILQDVAVAKLEKEVNETVGKALAQLKTLSVKEKIDAPSSDDVVKLKKEFLSDFAIRLRAKKERKNNFIASQIEKFIPSFPKVLTPEKQQQEDAKDYLLFQTLVVPLLEKILTERTMQSSADMLFTSVTNFLGYVQNSDRELHSGNQENEMQPQGVLFSEHFKAESLDVLKKQGMETIIATLLKSISNINHSKGAALSGPLPKAILLGLSALDRLPDGVKKSIIEALVETVYAKLEFVLVDKLTPMLGLMPTTADTPEKQKLYIEILFWSVVPNLLNHVLIGSMDGPQGRLETPMEERNISWNKLVDQLMGAIREMQFKPGASVADLQRVIPEVGQALAAIPPSIFQQQAPGALLLQPQKKFIEDASASYFAGRDIYEVVGSVFKRLSPMQHLPAIAEELSKAVKR